jgi:predicted amidohydrolase
MAGDSQDWRARQNFAVIVVGRNSVEPTKSLDEFDGSAERRPTDMKIAAAQISCAPGDIGANVRKIRDFASRAKESGVELIVFPEMVDTGYSMPVIQKHATSWNEGAVPKLQKMAKELAISIVAGVSDRDGANIYNSQIVIDRNGQIVAKYRKTHLVTAAPLDERPYFKAGDAFATCKIDPPSRSSGAASKFNFGLSICYDLRFPEFCRTLALKHHTNVFVNSSAWPFPRVEHLRILALARAIENQSYLILANRVGTDDGVTFCGTSAIIDPYGAIVAAASVDREELIQADISDEVIDSVRKRMLVFEHRRGDLY